MALGLDGARVEFSRLYCSGSIPAGGLATEEARQGWINAHPFCDPSLAVMRSTGSAVLRQLKRASPYIAVGLVAALIGTVAWKRLSKEKEVDASATTQTYDMTFTPEEAIAIGAAGPTSGANTGTGPGQTPASTATPWLSTASHAIDVSGAVLVATINGSNDVERERIRAHAAEVRAQILSDMRVAIASDPNGAQALRLQALALQQTIDALQPKQNNTMLYVALGGVGILAVAAIVYVVMSGRKRSNPRRRRAKKAQ